MDIINILAKFDLDGKTYLITLSNNNIVFYSYSNKKYSKALSREELETCFKILDSLLIRKETSIYLRDRKIGNNIYQIFYDSKTDLCWWNCITSKNINDEDYEILMNLYNNIQEVYYFSLMEKNEKKTTTSIIRKILNKTIRVYISATAISLIITGALYTYSLPQSIVKLNDEQVVTVMDYFKYMENTGLGKIQDEKAKEYRENLDSDYEYNWREIEQAIDENPYLKQNEKDFIKKFKCIFDSHHGYMNIPMVIDRLKTFRADYFEGRIPFKPLASGVYYTELNHAYYANAYSIDDVHKWILIHEFIHVIAISSSGKSIEYVTDLATREFLIKLIENGEIKPKSEWYDSNGGLINYKTAYSHSCKLFYLLLNLVDEETRLKYLYQTDERLLAEALIKIDKTSNPNEAKSRAYNLVFEFSKSFEFPDSNIIVDKITHRDYTDQEIYNKLNYYYEMKFGHSIASDLNSVLELFEKEPVGMIETAKRKVGIPTYNEITPPMKETIEETLGLSQKIIDNITIQPQGLFFDDIPPIIYYTEDKKPKNMILTNEIKRTLTEKYNYKTGKGNVK